MPTTNAFLATFLACVAHTLKWGGAHTFTEAVTQCCMPDTVRGHFRDAGYADSAITAERLRQCATTIGVDPAPVSFAVGTMVRYTGEDLSPIVGSEPFVLAEVQATGEATPYYSGGGITWIPHTDVQFVAAPTAESLKAACVYRRTESGDVQSDEDFSSEST